MLCLECSTFFSQRSQFRHCLWNLLVLNRSVGSERCARSCTILCFFPLPSRVSRCGALSDETTSKWSIRWRAPFPSQARGRSRASRLTSTTFLAPQESPGLVYDSKVPQRPPSCVHGVTGQGEGVGAGSHEARTVVNLCTCQCKWRWGGASASRVTAVRSLWQQERREPNAAGSPCRQAGWPSVHVTRGGQVFQNVGLNRPHVARWPSRQTMRQSNTSRKQRK